MLERVKAKQCRRIQKRRAEAPVQVQGVQVDGAVQVTHPVRVRLRLMHGGVREEVMPSPMRPTRKDSVRKLIFPL